MTTKKESNETDLASERFGGRILFATDEWFAAASNLLAHAEPIFIADKFTSYGKWMDGWETRRKRIPGHDWCIIELGLPGVISSVHIDTAYFTGNNAPQCSIQGTCVDMPLPKLTLDVPPGEMGTCASPQDLALEHNTWHSAQWETLLPRSPLASGYPDTRYHVFDLAAKSSSRYTHLRLNVFPDGGIARLRVYGQVAINWTEIASTERLDLLAATNGGLAISCSDQHYGEPKNLIGPGRALNMGDGWETARKATRPAILTLDEDGLLHVPGNDWAILKLGTLGRVEEFEVDTYHFKGNFPESCVIEGGHWRENDERELDPNLIEWQTLVSRVKLSASHQHFFQLEALSSPINVIKLTIFPDGGVSRLRAYGYHV